MPDGVMFFCVPLPPMDHDALTDATPESLSVTLILIVDARAVPGVHDRNGSSSSQIAPGLVIACPRAGGVSSGGGGGGGASVVVVVVSAGGGGGGGSGVAVVVVVSPGGTGGGGAPGVGATVEVVVPGTGAGAGLAGAGLAGAAVSDGVAVVAVVVSGAPEVLDDVPVEVLTGPGATPADVDVLVAAELDVEPASGGRVIVTPSTWVREPASGSASCPLRATPTAVAAPMSTMTNAARPRSSRR